LATGFGFGITKSIENDQSHFEEKKVQKVKLCYRYINIDYCNCIREKQSKK